MRRQLRVAYPLGALDFGAVWRRQGKDLAAEPNQRIGHELRNVLEKLYNKF
jgi:hypothetical protein